MSALEAIRAWVGHKVAGDFITELRVDRGHALDQERFDAIVEWIVDRVSDQ